MKTIDEVVEQTTGEEVSSHEHKTLSRRMFVEAAALAGAGLMTATAMAQSRQESQAGRQGDSPSDPGPENTVLLRENPSANTPPLDRKSVV